MAGASEGDDVSVDESMLEIVTYHNRDFQKYAIDNGAYFEPIDMDESERLRQLHKALQILFQGQLIFPRSMTRSPHRVLECGFGSGSWALDVAELHPDCQVYGVDIWAGMVVEDPPRNLSLQIDDLNKGFTWDRNFFDFVHSQMVCGGIHSNQWRRYLRDIHRSLAPGGWAQMVEIYFNAQSDNGRLTDGHAIRRWSSKYMQALQQYKDPRAPMRLRTWMENAGFVDVETQQLKLPLSAWSSVQREQNAGREIRSSVQRMLWSLAAYPFTQFLGMGYNEAHVMVAQASRDAEDPSLKVYFPVYVCVGRKRR